MVKSEFLFNMYATIVGTSRFGTDINYLYCLCTFNWLIGTYKNSIPFLIHSEKGEHRYLSNTYSYFMTMSCELFDIQERWSQ